MHSEAPGGNHRCLFRQMRKGNVAAVGRLEEMSATVIAPPNPRPPRGKPLGVKESLKRAKDPPPPDGRELLAPPGPRELSWGGLFGDRPGGKITERLLVFPTERDVILRFLVESIHSN